MASRTAPGRRIPKNPKYADVKPKVDTGASASKYEEKLAHLQKYYKLRKDEIFKRMKANTLALLVLEVAEAEDDYLAEHLDEAATYGDAPQRAAYGAPPQQRGRFAERDDASVATARTDMSAATSFANFVNGVGDLDLAAPEPTELVQFEKPYLLLDVRDKDLYDVCHIVGAQSYPHTMLSRSVNYFTKDIQMYMNQPGKIIVLYDEDESLAHKAATIFVQRGVDNVFLLGGGLRILLRKYPEGFVVGEAPPTCRPAKTKKGRRESTPRPAATTSAAYASAKVPEYAPLTADNLERIRQQLEDNLLEDDAKSTTSRSRPAGRATSLASTARSTAPRRSRPPGAGAGAGMGSPSRPGTSASSKAWR